MADRERAAAGKRRTILDAAVRAFAAKGYHACRVGDIAEEARVAYGLVYHYFPSKEAVLETVFRETWGALLAALRELETRQEPAEEKVRTVAVIVLRSWRNDPDLVRVLVREVARSPHLQQEVDEVALAFAALERILDGGVEEGTSGATWMFGWRRGCSTARWRRSSPAGCSGGFRTRTRTWPRRSRPSRTCSAAAARVETHAQFGAD